MKYSNDNIKMAASKLTSFGNVNTNFVCVCYLKYKKRQCPLNTSLITATFETGHILNKRAALPVGHLDPLDLQCLVHPVVLAGLDYLVHPFDQSFLFLPICRKMST